MRDLLKTRSLGESCAHKDRRSAGGREGVEVIAQDDVLDASACESRDEGRTGLSQRQLCLDFVEEPKVTGLRQWDGVARGPWRPRHWLQSVIAGLAPQVGGRRACRHDKCATIARLRGKPAASRSPPP